MKGLLLVLGAGALFLVFVKRGGPARTFEARPTRISFPPNVRAQIQGRSMSLFQVVNDYLNGEGRKEK